MKSVHNEPAVCPTSHILHNSYAIRHHSMFPANTQHIKNGSLQFDLCARVVLGVWTEIQPSARKLVRCLPDLIFHQVYFHSAHITGLTEPRLLLKLSLSTPLWHMEEAEVYLHSFLASVLVTGERSTSGSSRFPWGTPKYCILSADTRVTWPGCRLNDPGFRSRQRQEVISPSKRPDRLWSELPSLMLNGQLGPLRKVNRPRRDVDHPLPSTADVKNEWSYTSTPSWRRRGQLYPTAST